MIVSEEKKKEAVSWTAEYTLFEAAFVEDLCL